MHLATTKAYCENQIKIILICKFNLLTNEEIPFRGCTQNS